MKKPFFSILVPVYNVEKYLAECIASVLLQNFSDYELILADDGSTDASGAIMDEYAAKFPFVKVFHKENEGLLQTRRFLLEKSSGEFLLFLDSDDAWERGLLEMVYDTIAEHDADMVLFAFKKVDDMGRTLFQSTDIFPDQTVITRENKGLIYAEMARGSWLNSLWMKAVRRDLVDFDTDYGGFGRIMIGEDLLLSLPLFKNAKKIVFRYLAYYRYRKNETGATSNFRPQYIMSLDATRRALYEALREEGYDTRENLCAFFSQYLLIMYQQALNIARMEGSNCAKKQWFQKVRDLALYRHAVSIHCYRRFEKHVQFVFFFFRIAADNMFLLLANSKKGGSAFLPPHKEAEASRANGDEKAIL